MYKLEDYNTNGTTLKQVVDYVAQHQDVTVRQMLVEMGVSRTDLFDAELIDALVKQAEDLTPGDCLCGVCKANFEAEWHTA